ncbi:protein translocase subunit TIM13 [Penicillium chermesinum]|uniref:Mitochondrial import inner membrane translocase subunit n=1 Tax=Penicillium chermesinum TaxID=63820 RepID=A0A9W9TI76_9EURO|nr:protein translocase subunit TIM13 [Penicillium chermesinum]KAJ5223817.1 protein translocase subunit TIM13 [Penicillium chermesinum]KAJ6155357.1 protein translocase subunit TIM13 [Penicillium chermesinum]
MSFFGSSSSTPSSSAEVKAAIIQQLQQEQAITNARALVDRINENCFEACIQTPGSSTSSAENTCLSNCMNKYISMWNTTHRTYVKRMSNEQKTNAALAGSGSGL